MFFATTQTANFATNGANLSAFLFFSLLAGLVVASIVHLIGGVLSQNRLQRMLQSMVSGLVVTVVISLVTSWITGDNGQTSIPNSIVAASGLAPQITGMTQTTLDQLLSDEVP